MDITEIIPYLKQNELKNCNIIYFIEDNYITYLEKCDNAIIAKGISDRSWVYFSCSNESELDELLKFVYEEDRSFAVVTDWMLNFLSKKSKLEIELSTQKLYLPESVILPAPELEITPLKVSDAQFIYNNSDYKEFIPIDYVKNRIRKGISAGIFQNGNPVGWAITHDDGAIGFLHVLPEYRGKGYAKEITAYMINKVRSINRIPFAHVETDNTISLNLVNRLGFKFYDNVHWVKKK